MSILERYLYYRGVCTIVMSVLDVCVETSSYHKMSVLERDGHIINMSVHVLERDNRVRLY